MGLNQCRIIDLPKISDPRGNLTFIEGGSHIPFDIRRVYYLYDVPGGAERGAHGHKALRQLIVAMSGYTIPFESPTPAPWLIVGGLIVGIGVYFGSGCTSGHGVCGMARISPRSIAATLTFMVSTAATVFVVRHLIGGL